MNKQDSNGSRNAQDIERKYDFASFLGLKKNVETQEKGITQIKNELNKILEALIINLKNVLDDQSEISLWFYSGIPTNQNEPYNTWVSPMDHIGDIYYDKETGYVYQLGENLIWEVNPNPDLVQAMALTNAETDTSQDHERKVYFTTPTIPYSNGDWWIKENGELFICQISKSSGIYEQNDFINSSDYTNGTISEKIDEALTVLKGCVTIMTDSYAKFTDLATGGSTTIAGENIKTGSIQSNNYIENESGTKINLLDGTIDTKKFKLDNEGNIIASDSILNNININGGKIEIESPKLDPKFIIKNNNQEKVSISDFCLKIKDKMDSKTLETTYKSGGYQVDYDNKTLFSTGFMTEIDGTIGPDITLFNTTMMKSAILSPFGLWAPAFNQNSLEKLKKNFEKFEDAIKIIKNSDIYKYNWKSEKDTDKKHIGLVIGKKFKTPKEVLSKDEKNVDLYSMVSICFQAIKEQQKEIDELKQELEVIKNDKNR